MTIDHLYTNGGGMEKPTEAKQSKIPQWVGGFIAGATALAGGALALGGGAISLDQITHMMDTVGLPAGFVVLGALVTFGFMRHLDNREKREHEDRERQWRLREREFEARIERDRAHVDNNKQMTEAFQTIAAEVRADRYQRQQDSETLAEALDAQTKEIATVKNGQTATEAHIKAIADQLPDISGLVDVLHTAANRMEKAVAHLQTSATNIEKSTQDSLNSYNNMRSIATTIERVTRELLIAMVNQTEEQPDGTTTGTNESGGLDATA